MRLEHISVTVNPNDEPENAIYTIRAELHEIPDKQWQDGLNFVWYNSPYYLCNRSELTIADSKIELLLENSGNLQNAIDTLSSSIMKAEKMIKSSGISYISNYRMTQG